jgi:phytoene dehydrogenase-like protein
MNERRSTLAQEADAIVIGAGPNGLVAAIALAQAGMAVQVLEAQDRPGGAVWTHQPAAPGFHHDLGASFFPFGRKSPAFVSLQLETEGLRWCEAPIDSLHPAPDGSFAALTRDPARRARLLGNNADGHAWARLIDWHARHEPALIDLFLGSLGSLRPLWRLGPAALFRLASTLARSGRSLSEQLFISEPARRVLPGLALHVDAGPDDTFGAGIGYMLGVFCGTGGFPFPAGGAGALTEALLARLHRLGGAVATGQRVEQIRVEGGRAVAVRTSTGEQLGARHAIVANTGAPALLLRLLDAQHVSPRVLSAMRRFPYGWGTFKVDWALSGPTPWSVAEGYESAVVHAGDSMEDLARFTRQVRAGDLPDRPYLVIGQHSVGDPSRAPAGAHTLQAYTRVPTAPPGGWARSAELLADRMEARIEELAPGFRSRILARHITTPEGLEALDENLVGGDLGGGSNAWHRQLIFRPVFPHFRYRMPVGGLYLCSSYAHPGAGVHGMGGWNAAAAVLADAG